MPIFTGGWTVDTGVVKHLDSTGEIVNIFNNLIKAAVKKKLCALEIAGDLTNPEKGLRDSGDYSVERIKQFIQTNAKYTAREMYMPFADIESCIETSWDNILKRWSEPLTK